MAENKKSKAAEKAETTEQAVAALKKLKGGNGHA